MTNATARTDFAVAIAQIASERKISAESIIDSIQQAIEAAYRREKNIPYLLMEEEGFEIKAEVNQDTGEARVFRLENGKKEDVTPAGFGRIAAQTAKQVILQKIREAEKKSILSDFADRIGDIVNGMVLRMDGKNVIVDIGRGQGIMPPEEQMRGEFYRMNSRITVYVKEIRETHRGESIIVSRADKELVAKLFEREVPEVASGAVQIKAVAREAGVRTKIAVFTEQTGVDPVGACVGQRGVRVQEVIREVNNEKIDIVPFSEDLKLYIAAALAPAESLLIEINEEDRSVLVTAPDDQLSLAIGRGGQNVRLAAKLTGYKISIKSKEGETKMNVTGEEEYEVDQAIKDLTQETREILIQNRLTTLDDLDRRQDRWMEFKDIPDDQKQLLQQALKNRRETDLKRREERVAHDAKEVEEAKDSAESFQEVEEGEDSSTSEVSKEQGVEKEGDKGSEKDQ